MKKYQDLYEFIDRAEKSRKYTSERATVLKSALRLFEKELNDEELNSFEKFKDNVDEIYRNVVSKNKNFSASSLATYKSRISTVINDFERYGVDPVKMVSWQQKVKKTKMATGNNPTTNNPLILPLNNNLQDNTFFDSGKGWSLTIKCTRLINSEVKKKIIDISEMLEKINSNNSI